MVTLTALWLPILLSAVAVFLASSLVHMVFTYHRSDYGKLPEEDRVVEAIRGAKVPPGTYMFPHAGSPKELRSPEMLAKFERGPLGMLTVRPGGPPVMGKNLAQWFVFCLVISVFVAYVCGRTLAAGTDYLAVFRIAGVVALLGYASGDVMASIWKWQGWGTTAKGVLDGLVYALLTAGVFGWLWPAA
jgi:hypothetical protein